jgi:hypothetical protein
MATMMFMKVKSSARAAVSWIQSNPISLFLFIIAFAMGIAFIMYPHFPNDGCHPVGSCATGGITFD